MNSSSFTFRAELLTERVGDTHIQALLVPPAVVAALGGAPGLRVLATLNGHVLRRGLLPRADGRRHLLLGRLVCRRLGLAVGDELSVTLALDPHSDQVDLPEELAEGLAAWPEAAAAFARLTPGRQRSVAYRVAGAQRAETRLQRAMKALEALARLG